MVLPGQVRVGCLRMNVIEALHIQRSDKLYRELVYGDWKLCAKGLCCFC